MLIALALAAALAFPNVAVRDLEGRAMETRQAIREPVAILIGFTYGARAEVEAWERDLLEATNGALRVVQMPVFSGVAVLARPMIESGMARKLSKAERANVWGSTERDALVQGLKIEAPDRAAVLALVDASGNVRLVTRGAPTPESRSAFVNAWKALRGD